MNMIGHQAIGIDLKVEFFLIVSENIQIFQIVLLLLKKKLPVSPFDNDVVRPN